MPNSELPDFLVDSDDEETIAVKITPLQHAVLKRLSHQRSASFWALIDLTGEMSHEGLEFFRRMGAPEGKAIGEFLTGAKPETLKFLAEMRNEEVETLKSGIKLVIAFQWAGWAIKWLIISAFGMFVGGMTIFKEVASWFKSTH